MTRIIVGLMGTSLIMATPLLHANEREMKSPDARATVQSWPKEKKKAAEMMIQKYGEPDEVTAMRVVWYENGPWKRTIAAKEETDHAFRMPHRDVLEQVIDYRVSTDKVDDLAKYDGSVIVERTKGELRRAAIRKRRTSSPSTWRTTSRAARRVPRRRANSMRRPSRS